MALDGVGFIWRILREVFNSNHIPVSILRTAGTVQSLLCVSIFSPSSYHLTSMVRNSLFFFMIDNFPVAAANFNVEALSLIYGSAELTPSELGSEPTSFPTILFRCGRLFDIANPLRTTVCTTLLVSSTESAR